MATSFATMKSTAPRVPLGLSFPLPPAAHHKLMIASKTIGALPEQGPAFDPQILLDQAHGRKISGANTRPANPSFRKAIRPMQSFTSRVAR